MDKYHSNSSNGSQRPYYPPPASCDRPPMPPVPQDLYPPPPVSSHPGVPPFFDHVPSNSYAFPHSEPQFLYPYPHPHPSPSLYPNPPPMPLQPPTPPFGYLPNFQQTSFYHNVTSYHHSQHDQSDQFPYQENPHAYQGSASLAPSLYSHGSFNLCTPSAPTVLPNDVGTSGHLSDGQPTSGILSASSSFNGSQRQDSGYLYAGIYKHEGYSFSEDSQRSVSQQIVLYPGGKTSLKVLLLHGSLDMWISEAKNLPNMDMFSKILSDMFKRKVSTRIADKIDQHMPTQHSMTSDPYVSVSISKAVIARTYVISNNENPIWKQHFCVLVAHHAAEVQFFVKDSDMVGSQLIGTVSIPVVQIYSGLKVEGTFPILGPDKTGATLKMSVQYIPIERLTSYNLGVVGLDYRGIPGTYFPLRKGGKVTLYQDAHVPDDCLQSLRLDGHMYYQHGKCWWDIFEAIKQASRLIYIAGWSVYHMIKLVREPDYCSDTLGDLLKKKSQEGVRVLLLVWDDPTSRSLLGLQTPFSTVGGMGGKGKTRSQMEKKSLWPEIIPKSHHRATYLKDSHLFTVQDFFTSAESKAFIQAADSVGFVHQGSLGPAKGEAYRDNDRISVQDPILAEKIWKSGLDKLFIGIEVQGRVAVGLNPNIRFYRYKVGQRFGPHIDESVDLEGGHSTQYTLLVYLNGHSTTTTNNSTSNSQNLVGGETVFYDSRKRIVAEVAPAEGMALLHLHGKDCMLHEARIVKKSVKYVLRSDVVFA